MASMSVLGLFQEPDPAADAMDGLAAAGFEKGTFDVLTGTPYPEGAFGEHVPQHRLFRFPAFGAIIGFTVALVFTAATQIAYPVVSGGKPILSLFAMLIIIYELTMLSRRHCDRHRHHLRIQIAQHETRRLRPENHRGVDRRRDQLRR